MAILNSLVRLSYKCVIFIENPLDIIKCILKYIFNSSHPSATYMREGVGSTMIQVMSWRLFGAKLISKLMLVIVNWSLRNQLQWNCSEDVFCDIGGDFVQWWMDEKHKQLSKGPMGYQSEYCSYDIHYGSNGPCCLQTRATFRKDALLGWAPNCVTYFRCPYLSLIPHL